MKQLNPQNLYVPKTKYEKIMQRRGNITLLIAYFLSLGAMILGIITSPHLTSIHIHVTEPSFIVLLLMSFTLIPINLLLHKRLKKKMEQMPVKDMQQYIYSHREFAEEMIAKKYKLLRFLRIITTVYYILLGIIALSLSFLAGCNDTDSSRTTWCLLAAIILASALSRIRLPIPNAIFQDDKRYVDKADYPYLYALVQKAADTLNCNTYIKIAITDDFNAGIARYGATCSVQLGALLINTLTEEELFSVLLHEFSHMDSQHDLANAEMNYFYWLEQGRAPHFVSGLTQIFTLYLDSLYSLNYSLFQYASSIHLETDADSAMIKYGSAKVAASALLKMKYFYLYQWEQGTYDVPAFFSSETLEKGFLSVELEDFFQRLQTRIKDWKHYAEVEILSRNATHPTLKMRLEAFGITTYELLESKDSHIYKSECRKALSFVEELICDDLSKSYAQVRQQRYVQPKQMIDEWEAAGKPLVAVDYADIGFALRQLGRNSDALELYHRAITELSLPSEICHAQFIIGCSLLHQFDSSGLEYVYCAIENNSNYIDEGLDVIGEFCCLTGNQIELDRFREKAMDLAQTQKDVYSQLNILTKKDNLTSENLPDGMLNEILLYISKIDEQAIQAIYLVRKNITKDFFTSVFVIEFESSSTDETKEKVLHKIFTFLNTFSSWQFSLFEYSQIENVKLDKVSNSCVYRK